MIRNPRQRLWLLLSLIVSAAAALMLLYHTRNGPGITGDSVHYVMGADNLFLGRGYARTGGGGEAIPITGFPPGYSIALVMVRLFSDDLFAGARILNVLLFSLNVFLVSWLVYHITKYIWPALAAAVIMALSEDMIHVHAWVMSEALFLALMLLVFWLLLDILPSRRYGGPIVLGATIAAATMVRYVGFSLAALAGIWILLAPKQTWKVRIQQLVIFSIIFLVPVVLWFMRNASLANTLVNRSVAYHPLDRDLITAFLGTMNAWFFPLSLGLPTPVRALLSSSIFLAIPVSYGVQKLRMPGGARNLFHQEGPDFPLMMLIFLPLYVGLLLVNSMFLDASTSPSGAARYLAPVFVATLLMLACSLASLGNDRRAGRLWRKGGTGLALLILILYSVGTVEYVRNPGEDFRYTDSKRSDPALVNDLIRLGEDHKLLSNDIERVYAISGRTAYALPIRYDHYQQQYRQDFEEQIDFAEDELLNGAIIVYFGEPTAEDQAVLDMLGVSHTRHFYSADLYQLP